MAWFGIILQSVADMENKEEGCSRQQHPER